MFDSKKIIVSLKKNNLLVASINNYNPSLIEPAQEITWEREHLGEIFSQIKDTYGDKIRLLLDEEFVCVTSIKISSTSKVVYDTVQRLAQETIPEDLKKTSWDYKEILQVESDAKTQYTIIQVALLVPSFQQILISAIEQSGITVEAIEPLSYTLAYQIRNRVDPLLLLYREQDNRNLVCVIHRGLVIFSQICRKDVNVKDLEKIIILSQDRYHIRPNALYLVGVPTVFTPEQFSIPNFKIEDKDLNPMIGLAQLDEVRTKNERNLNTQLHTFKIEPTKEERQSVKPAKKVITQSVKQQTETYTHTTPPEHHVQSKDYFHDQELTHQATSHNKVYMVIGTIIIGLVIAGTVVITQMASGKKITNQSVKKELATQQMEKPTQEPTPEALDLSQFKISILNGSGVAGEAKKMTDFITDKGFDVSETGNADVSTYKKTEIQAHEDIDKAFIDELKKTLEEQYKEIIITTSKKPNEITVLIGKESL